MKNPKQFKFDIIGLDCANCANKIERKINDTENIKEAIVDFLNKKIIIASLLFITGFFISKNNNLLRFIIFFVSYIVIGGDE